MQGKVALEEHFALPETVGDSAGFVPGDYWIELKARLLDMQNRRLREMDAHGVEMMLPLLNAAAVQAIPDRGRAAEVARRANNSSYDTGMRASAVGMELGVGRVGVILGPVAAGLLGAACIASLGAGRALVAEQGGLLAEAEHA